MVSVFESLSLKNSFSFSMTHFLRSHMYADITSMLSAYLAVLNDFDWVSWGHPSIVSLNICKPMLHLPGCEKHCNSQEACQ